jgi:predicted acylesterase/phospholipase RssA
MKDNKNIGLALGSGGMKGFAHIGGFYNRKKLIQLGLDSTKEALDKAGL